MTNTIDPLLDRTFMRAFLDTVIPQGPDGRMPGAGSLSIEDALATAIGSDSRSGTLIRAGLAAVAARASEQAAGGLAELAPEERTGVVEAVLAAHPQLMQAFARHLYLAYYQHPEVLVAIGEPPHPPFPGGFTVEPTDPELMERLLARRIEPHRE